MQPERKSLSLANANKKPQDFKNGHETILKSAINKGIKIQLKLVNGSDAVGVVTQFDNYTITLDLGLTKETFFKHGILSFKPY